VVQEIGLRPQYHGPTSQAKAQVVNPERPRALALLPPSLKSKSGANCKNNQPQALVGYALTAIFFEENRAYLNSGIMREGVVQERQQGTPQGGPLSPLPAKVLLDEVDKELERRGQLNQRVHRHAKTSGQSLRLPDSTSDTTLCAPTSGKSHWRKPC